jgi:ABC-type multidrug transport system fused ATPase/permease subunit
VVVLDEASSALDAQAERRILHNVWTVFKDRLVLYTAHRLNTVATADRIIVLDGGRIVADGTHAELSASDTAYSELVRAYANVDYHRTQAALIE